MKRPYFAAALLVLLGTNAWVLAHVALNRWGAPDAEMELTSRELEFRRASGEERGVTLALRWQNPVPQYRYTPFESDGPGWFDQTKLVELGFDCSVPAADARASRYYREAPSREVFVALEYDGAAWGQWLAGREPALRTQQLYSSDLTFEQRLEIERGTLSRLVAVDAGADGAALRRKYPDRARVLILRALAVVVLEERRTTPPDKSAHAAYLRGGISRILIDTIYVPQPLSRSFSDDAGMNWSYSKGVLKVEEPRYAVGLRTGSRYEPWVTSVRKR